MRNTYCDNCHKEIKENETMYFAYVDDFTKSTGSYLTEKRVILPEQLRIDICEACMKQYKPKVI